MNGFRSTFAREMRRRRMPLAAAALAGLLAMAMPWFPGVSTEDPAGLASILAMVSASLWILALAVLEGSRFLVADLRERRLAWDFRLPVSAGAIWGGRLAAALVNLFGGVFLCVLPALVTGVDLSDLSPKSVVLPRLPTLDDVDDPAWGVAAAALCALFLLNRLALAAAARTWRGAVDLLLLVLVKAAAIQSVYMLWRATADRSTVRVVLLALVATAFALAVSSFAQVRSGRSELVPAERAASRAWLVLAPIVAIVLLGWSWTVLHPPLRALAAESIRARPIAGDLIWISGETNRDTDLATTYLLSPADGRTRFVGNAHQGLVADQPSTTPDGSLFAWIETERIGTNRWHFIPLTQASSGLDSPRTRSAIVWRHSPNAWTLTGDGQHVASIWSRHRRASPTGLELRIEELATGGLVRTIALPDCNWWMDVIALDRSRVRVSCGGKLTDTRELAGYLIDVDLSTGAGLQTTRDHEMLRPLDIEWVRGNDESFELARPALDGYLSAKLGERRGPDGSRIAIAAPESLLRQAADRGSLVAISATGACFLPDGRLAVAIHSGDSSVLALYGRDGEVVKTIPLGEPVFEHCQPVRNGASLVLLSREPKLPKRRHRIHLSRLDLDSGQIVDVASHLRERAAETTAVPRTLFLDEYEALFRLDVESGELLPLLR
jgi:hypothetical protein